jgi:uncharacterized membrane protein YccC
MGKRETPPCQVVQDQVVQDHAGQDRANRDDEAPDHPVKGYAKLPVSFDLRALSVLEGLRAGVAIAVTMAAGSLLNLPELGLAALGALEACLADPGGPIMRRLPVLFSFGVLAALLYGGFGLLRAEPLFIVVPVATAAIFCLTFVRVYGQSVMLVGNMLSVIIILALDRVVPSFILAAKLALELFAGVAWAMVLTLMVWRIRPYGPARGALGQLARRLADLAGDLDHLARNAESPAAFDAHAREHRAAVRDAIEQARAVAFGTVRQRGAASARANQLAVRLASFEHLFSLLIALSELIADDQQARGEAAPALRLVAGWLAMIGPEIEADRSLDTSSLNAPLARLQNEIAKLDEGNKGASGQMSGVSRLLDAVAERLAVLMTVSVPAGQAPDQAETPQLSAWRRIADPVRANLSWQSAPLRHTLRVAICVGPALAFSLSIGSVFAHWLTITLIFTLQPYFSATWVRALERIAGTALGGLLAALLAFICTTRLSVAIAMIPLTIIAFTVRAVSFTVWIAVLTPVIVLIIEQLVPGTDQLSVALARVGFTLLGGGIAVLANLLLFPGFEYNRLGAVRQAAINAHVAWLDAVFVDLLAAAPVPDAVRRQAGLASNNLEASISRALLEPHRRRDPALGSAIVTDAALRRLAGRLAVLDLDRPVIGPAARPLWVAWRDWLEAVLRGELAPPRPALPQAAPGAAAPGAVNALTRLARQVELIAYGEQRDAVHGSEPG